MSRACESAVFAAPRRQRGVALLVALLVVALAVILVAALLDRGELALARTRNLSRAEQAEAYAQGLELYAGHVLLATQAQQPGVDTNASAWAMPMPPQEVPGGLIGATMRDLNGCFNLNNLVPGLAHQGEWEGVFKRLLTVRGVDPQLAGAVEDWLDPGATGTSDNTYLAQPVPYRAAHRNFAHVSELRLVAGVNGDVYARLAPYVCALPSGTRINVNTASVPVLQSLGASGIPQPIAEKLRNDGHADYEDLALFAADAGDSSLATSPLLATASSYFLARGDIVLDGIPITFYSLIQRAGGISVIERSRGGDGMPNPLFATPR